MAKAVFRQSEVIADPEKVTISSPVWNVASAEMSQEAEEAAAEPEKEVYLGPTVEELRQEAEAYKLEWEIEKEAMIQEAKLEADGIIKAANYSGEREKDLSREEANAIITRARGEAESIIAGARQQAGEIEAETRRTLEDEKKEALEQGREAGRKEGYTEGMAEVERLIQRTQVVLERAQDKRGEILAETEQEIINMVLLIARKVIKVISDNQREVIISNVVQALRKVRDRGNVIIHVNLADLKLTTEHTKEFIRLLEGVKSIQVVEDSAVDSGGCIIETDFGEVDARISSQLAEIETKILSISPIKAKIKPPSASHGRPAVNP